MQVSEMKIRPRLLNPKIRPLTFNLALSVLALGEWNGFIMFSFHMFV